jgi:hypothetical protein
MIRHLHIACFVALGCTTASPLFAQTTGGTTTTTTSSSGGSSSSSGIGSGPGIGTGSSTGSGSSTSGSPFTGGVASTFGTQSTGGTTAGTKKGTGTTANATPTTNNPFQATYVNPYAVGATNSTASTGKNATATAQAFGQPVYSISNTKSTTSSLSSSSNAGLGFSTVGQLRGPHYSTVLSPDVPLVTRSPDLQRTELNNVLARSSLISKNNMQVDVQGSLVVLSGTAANERERRLAESLVSLTPGVVSVENRLKLPGQP